MLSQHLRSTRHAAQNWLRSLLIVLALNGCGGVDSGGTGAPITASGPITGFGSVIINGVHFDETQASITDADGAVHTSDELKLGMTTAVTGSSVVTDANGSHSTATTIVFGSAILGPVESIDAMAKSLVVLGQTVDVNPTTVFESGLSGGLSALSVGDVVEVYALFDAATNRFTSTRIERKTTVSQYRLRGVVTNLDTAGKTFNIGTERISYAGLAATDVPSTLANGRFVRVQMQTTQMGGVRTAIKLQDGVRQMADRDEARVEGLISAFTSSAQFSVDGVPVDASHATFPAGSAGLGLGVRVAIKSTTTSDVLVATEVLIKTETDVESEGFELDASISSIDTVGKTLVLRGVTVDYSGTVDFRNGTIADLAAGKRVEINGKLSTDGTKLQATRIRF